MQQDAYAGLPTGTTVKEHMKLSVAGISLALLCGCASTPVMQPSVQPTDQALPPEPPAEPAQSESPCWDQVVELAEQAAAAAKNKYNEAKESGAVEDAKEAAAKLQEKAAKYWDSVTEE